MTTFETPGPISVRLELGVGHVRIVASQRSDTLVEVQPTNPSERSDVSAAEQTLVEHSAGRLLVKAPKSWRQYNLKGGRESVEVLIELPSGSDLSGEGGIATLEVRGRLGEVHYRSGVGDVHFEEVGQLRVRSGVGGIAAERVTGSADVRTGSGRVELGALTGAAVVRNANGDTRIGEVQGDLRVQSANGRIVVDHAHSRAVAKTSNGDIRAGIGSGGSVVAHTACGRIDVQLRDPVAAWLDLGTHFGRVHNELGATEKPGPKEETAEIRARTAFGDITVRRVAQAAARPQDETPRERTA